MAATAQGFSGIQKVMIVLLLLGAAGGVWHLMSGRASTTIGVELATPSNDCSSVGDLCPDGTYYVGTSWSTKLPQYITASPTSLGGLSYNNGNACSGPDTCTDGGSSNYSNGEANTRSLAVTDADSLTPGVQPHQAALACANLTAHGHSDWFLPSIGELETLYARRASIPVWSGTGIYISSSQYTSIYYYRLENGVVFNAITKQFSGIVHCMRTGTVGEAVSGTTLTSNPDLTRGLVGHWTFDGQDVDWSNTTAEIRDRSGNGNHGNALGGINAASGVTLGRIGQAGRFLGYPRYIAVPDSASIEPSTEITVAAWISMDEPNAVSEWSAFVSKGTNAQYAISMGQNGSAVSGYVKTSEGETWCGVAGFSNLGLKQWHHITMTYSSTDGQVVMYLNGEYQSTCPRSGTLANTSAPLYIGTLDSNVIAYNYLEGAVDDVRLYDRALSADEAKRLYELGATTKIAQTITSNITLDDGLVGHWTFDGPDVEWSNTTAEIRDRSNEGNHGDAQGGMTGASSPVPGALGQGLRFDGVTQEVEFPGSILIPEVSSLPITITGWINTSNSGGALLSIDDFLVGQSRSGVKVSFRSGKLSGFYHPCSDSVSACRREALTDDAVLPLNEWAHVAAVFVSYDDIRLFVNGVQHAVSYTGNTTSYTVFRNTRPSRIGVASNVHDNTYRTAGSVDDVRIYDRALSAEEVMRLYETAQ